VYAAKGLMICNGEYFSSSFIPHLVIFIIMNKENSIFLKFEVSTIITYIIVNCNKVLEILYQKNLSTTFYLKICKEKC